jgi:endonuclease/exonuclease/phosphatase family metal-dependent hydrolase
MADRSYRRWWVAAIGCLMGLLAACAPTSIGSTAAGPPAAGPPAAGPPAAGPPAAGSPTGSAVQVLHLNLCNSGIAACYTGRSVAEAAAVIRAETPDLVTLNEVCQDDVSALERALADAVPGAAAGSAFQAARDRTTGEPYRCRNGQQYGNGVVSRWPSVPGSSADLGIYPTQDGEDPEERAWVCLDVAATPAVAVCTTHLAYTDRAVTIAQCKFLFDTVITGKRTRNGAVPVVMGGDLNLGSGSPDLASCLPADSARVGDGDVQHVVATPEFVVDSSRTIDLRGATDHPGLLVTLAPG